MTFLPDLLAKFETAKATKTDITISFEELQALIGVARIMGPENAAAALLIRAADAGERDKQAIDNQINDPILTIAQVCEDLGISDVTLLKMRRTGRFIDHIQISERKIGFRRSDLINWKAQRSA